MTVLLTSENLTVNLLSAGAELCSVKNKEEVEFIWQADKDVWPRHAPVLFPIVGKLKDGFYNYSNQRYDLGQHGFARDFEFELTFRGKSFATFELRSDKKSKEHFPFDFIFQINYSLSGNTLTTEYKVINPSENTLLFSVGAHPGFKCPVSDSEKFEDYFLEFDSSDYQITELTDGLRKANKTSLHLKNNKLYLSKTLLIKTRSFLNTIKLTASL